MQPLVRQLLAAFAGFLLHQGITVDSTSSASLILGSLLFLGACAWSYLAKLNWVKERNLSALLNDSRADMLKKALGVLVSQGIAALAGWWQAKTGEQVNTADPYALLLLGVNALGSQLGWHQKLAGKGGKSAALMLAALLPLSVSSCAPITQALLDNRALVKGAIQYGVAAGVDAGLNALEARKAAAKNPVPNVNPAPKNPAPSVSPITQARKPGASGLLLAEVPDYGAARALRHDFKAFP